jgi:hypothetical protein
MALLDKTVLGRGPHKTRDLEIYEKERWARKFLLTLRHYDGNSVHFDALFYRVGDAVAGVDTARPAANLTADCPDIAE